MLQMIAANKRTADDVLGWTDFIKGCQCLLAEQSLHGAQARAEAMHLRPAVRTWLEQKAAQAGSTTSQIGINLGEFRGGVMSTLRNIGFAERVAQFARPVPLNLAIARFITGTSYSVGPVNEGIGKPVRAHAWQTTEANQKKVAAIMVQSKELAEGVGDEGARLLGADMRGSVSAGTDAAVFTALPGQSAEAMGQGSFSGFLEDLSEALRLLNLGAGSKVFGVLPPEVMKNLAVLAYGSGVESLGWDGGLLAGVEFLVSDSQSADRLTLLDASGLAISLGEISLHFSSETTLQMESAPTQDSTAGTGSTLASMWQTGSVALLAERIVTVLPVRVASYCHLTGVALGQDSGSPAGI